MNFSYLILLGGLISYFLPEDDMLIAQFNLYMNGERTEVTWETKIDRTIYGNDCQAFYDLYLFRDEICSVEEAQQLLEFLKSQEPSTPLKNDIDFQPKSLK